MSFLLDDGPSLDMKLPLDPPVWSVESSSDSGSDLLLELPEIELPKRPELPSSWGGVQRRNLKALRSLNVTKTQKVVPVKNDESWSELMNLAFMTSLQFNDGDKGDENSPGNAEGDGDPPRVATPPLLMGSDREEEQNTKAPQPKPDPDDLDVSICKQVLSAERSVIESPWTLLCENVLRIVLFSSTKENLETPLAVCESFSAFNLPRTTSLAEMKKVPKLCELVKLQLVSLTDGKVTYRLRLGDGEGARLNLELMFTQNDEETSEIAGQVLALKALKQLNPEVPTYGGLLRLYGRRNTRKKNSTEMRKGDTLVKTLEERTKWIEKVLSTDDSKERTEEDWEKKEWKSVFEPTPLMEKLKEAFAMLNSDDSNWKEVLQKHSDCYYD